MKEILSMKVVSVSTMLAIYLLAGPAVGFQETELEAVAKRVQATLGPGYRGLMGKQSDVTWMCTSCEGLASVKIQMRRSTDGIEDRLRTGQMTIADLNQQCETREATACSTERADVGRAIGWLSAYHTARAGIAGNTLVLFRDGGMLTVFSMSNTPKEARDIMQRIRRSVVPEIAGR
jgi:hypothetical protein